MLTWVHWEKMYIATNTKQSGTIQLQVALQKGLKALKKGLGVMCSCISHHSFEITFTKEGLTCMLMFADGICDVYLVYFKIIFAHREPPKTNRSIHFMFF